MSSEMREPAATPERHEAPRGEGAVPHGYRARVLVVDDEPSICRALEIALARAGFDATTVQSGDAAIDLVRREHFDVLVCDLRIPDMRGDVIYWTLAAVQPHLQGRTLFVTGDITERAQKLVAQCNCPMLHKPFDLGDILDAVAALAPRMRNATA